MQIVRNNSFINENVKNVELNKSASSINNQQVNFKNILDNKIEENRSQSLQFSKHANLRLSARDISLSSEQIKRVENGVIKAKEKGINDSLVLVDNIALVINVKNNVVITALFAMGNKERNDNVFTNIDGAVIV